MPFTAQELAEMAAADAEIEASFALTPEDLRRSRELDKFAQFQRKTPEQKKVAAQRKAWYEANREKWNAYQRAYRAKKKREAETP